MSSYKTAMYQVPYLDLHVMTTLTNLDYKSFRHSYWTQVHKTQNSLAVLLHNMEDASKCRLLCMKSCSQCQGNYCSQITHITTLLIQLPTFHTFHPHRHKSLKLEAAIPSPWDSLMPLPSINKHYTSHGPNSYRMYNKRHLKFHIFLLLYTYSRHIHSWRRSNSSKRLLLLVVTTIPMNRPTRQLRELRSHCSEKRNTSWKTRNGLDPWKFFPRSQQRRYL
jgi:hypothetical protein